MPVGQQARTSPSALIDARHRETVRRGTEAPGRSGVAVDAGGQLDLASSMRPRRPSDDGPPRSTSPISNSRSVWPPGLESVTVAVPVRPAVRTNSGTVPSRAAWGWFRWRAASIAVGRDATHDGGVRVDGHVAVLAERDRPRAFGADERIGAIARGRRGDVEGRAVPLAVDGHAGAAERLLAVRVGDCRRRGRPTTRAARRSASRRRSPGAAWVRWSRRRPIRGTRRGEVRVADRDRDVLALADPERAGRRVLRRAS